MFLEVDDDGGLVFHGLSPICADTLTLLPELLESEDPAVQRRLFPDVYRDEDDEAQWKRYGAPELEHLFASRIEIVRKDLATLEQEGELTYSLQIRDEHRSAWLSALNGARLSLFTQHGLAAEDMDREPGTIGDIDKDVALMRIHLLAFMQELMIEADGVLEDADMLDDPEALEDAADPDEDDDEGEDEEDAGDGDADDDGR